MLKINRLINNNTVEVKNKLNIVLDIFRDNFPYYKIYSEKIADFFYNPQKYDFEIVLLVAEGIKQRIKGFSLFFIFSDIKCAYLDYLSANKNTGMHGTGSLLYTSTRDYLFDKKINSLYYEVRPDVESKLIEKKYLNQHKRRLKFYERFGALPIINTDFDNLTTSANRGYLTYLMFDKINNKYILTSGELKKAIKKIFFAKYQLAHDHPDVKRIINSVKDNPVKLRNFIYTAKVDINFNKLNNKVDFVSVTAEHRLHHLKEKGYEEKPVRVDAILSSLSNLLINRYPLKSFGIKYIKAVHSSSLVDFIKESEKKLSPGRLLYPNVFHVRKAGRIPYLWEIKAGYFCIDTFTPLSTNTYKVAKMSVDCALTGADLLISGSRIVYSLCRPPGHHAEIKTFGGFCFFNNAAIAANYLAAFNKKVAILDLDYHHGNGTQDIFYQRNDIYTISIHGHPHIAYPYLTGYIEEKGINEGKGYNRNFPLYAGVDDNGYLIVLKQAVKTIDKFEPDYLIISFGLDILKGDPSGKFNITFNGLSNIAKELNNLNLPTLVIQEGGYSLPNLRKGVGIFLNEFVKSGNI